MTGRIHIQCIAISAILLLMSFSSAKSGYKIGDAVADFSLRSTEGKMISMNGYKDAKGMIVVFTCNHCPFAKKYQQRMNALNKKYGSMGYRLIAISSNDAFLVQEDSYENMKTRAAEEHYSFPYLYDETQAVAAAFGASRTPDAFVLEKVKGAWILKYSGAIDDNGGEPESVTHRYVEDAINALLAGKPVAVQETKSIGCPIKWKNT